ncbi:hypothetical protein ACT3TE_17375 [Brachybacterium sp. AOP42-B2-9]|uniref:hypothetical protein n=1 Tax=Brachybacterium sp. AOP42-B2-9 TaxID=3457672 RepID=UPI0040344FA4
MRNRHEWNLSSQPQVAPLGQRFSIYRAPRGYVHLFRYVTALGAALHPWATLEGLNTGRWPVEMMLKDYVAEVVDGSDVHPQPAIIIKRVHVPSPLQRTGLATTLLRDIVRLLYPDHFIHGEAPSNDALAWHRHLNTIWPSRMLHFPEPQEDRPFLVRRVSPGTEIALQELKRT